MSHNQQRALKSMVMSPDFEERFIAVNGIIIPSKIPQGGQVYKKKPWRGEEALWVKKARMTCIICGSGCQDKRGLRDHFVACVDRNGNPNGACWDDSLNPIPNANKRLTAFQITLFFSR